jgi:hypothetical protein
MALPAGAAAMAMQPCKEAGEALKYALLSFVCLGFVLGPMAVKKALDAKALMDKDPTLMGRGKANAAILLGSFVVVLWCVGVVSKMGGK